MVGMILGSPAQTAGVDQGDQLLQIDDMPVNGQSPFQAASAISGGDGEPDVIPEPVVKLQVELLVIPPMLHWCNATQQQDLTGFPVLRRAPHMLYICRHAPADSSLCRHVLACACERLPYSK